ncbi:uncharacterized protein KD926_002987 [Aspergillus affinis]|uniref:uncharacterized protein n=1 Tax=Aspergillus affinis TaxID=1070780 RepID=UPI0022FEE394|nr:uncharacterized protein KD926_002987 [Aspergillus affinis]KAI9035706.1 hypothetical protein KD926_002987 [Aspergillus affinis]
MPRSDQNPAISTRPVTIGQFHRFLSLYPAPKVNEFGDKSEFASPDLDQSQMVRMPEKQSNQAFQDPDLLLHIWQEFMQNDQVTFFSPEQAQALHLFLSRVPYLIMILPTAGGKTTLFLLGASLATSRTTILVAPLVALKQDLHQKALKLGLSVGVYEENPESTSEPSPSRILLISIESVATPAFFSYAKALIAKNQLDYIIFDECHLIPLAKNYRKVMNRIRQVTCLPAPMVFASATLPSHLERDLLQTLGLIHPVRIRANINKPSLFYGVKQVPTGIDLDMVALDLIRHFSERYPDQKTIIFCMSKRMVEEIHEKNDLITAYFHADLPDSDKQLQLHSFIESKKQILVATSAIGAGYDFQDIGLVIHLQGAHAFTDFIQESGRASRRPGALGFSYTLARPSDFNPRDSDSFEKTLFRDYLNEKLCRRRSIFRVFNDQALEFCLDDWQACDLYRIRNSQFQDVIQGTSAYYGRVTAQFPQIVDSIYQWMDDRCLICFWKTTTMARPEQIRNYPRFFDYGTLKCKLTDLLIEDFDRNRPYLRQYQYRSGSDGSDTRAVWVRFHTADGSMGLAAGKVREPPVMRGRTHPAEPTQPGTTESCGRYYKVASGDTCNFIALRLWIWDNCTNLWLDYDVCVAPVSATTVSEDGTCGPSYERGTRRGDFTINNANPSAAAPRADTAEPGLNTAALATVYPAHANPTTAPRPTAPAAQTGVIQRAVIQALALELLIRSISMASSEHHLPSSTPARPDGWPRITESSPVRDLGRGIMDYERCAALHNEILTRAVKGRGVEMPSKHLTWWEARAPSEEVANSLHPSLTKFLKRAWDENVLPQWSVLFLYIGALKSPDTLRDRMDLYEDEDEDGRFIKLYKSSHFRGLDNEGIVFDQTTLKATFIEDYNDTSTITSRPWGWMPLEVILDSYLDMIDDGKVQTISEDQAKLVKLDNPSCRVMDQWIIHYYTKTELERATAAFKRLVNLIESRILHRADSITPMHLPWHNPATFSNQDILPPFSFAYQFLKAISSCTVRFRYIAPGIRFPTVSEFQHQPITDFITSPYNHHGQRPGDCPLRVFQIDNVEQQPVPRDQGFGLHNIAAGFYIHPVVERWPHFWSNGCRLLLPFGIGGFGWARQSNGEPFGLDWYWTDDPKPRDTHGHLYQSGTVDGITNRHLVQIDKVLNNWADRVERGDWEIDRDGVTGGIGKLREADTEAHWQKYWIPPSW